MFQYTLAPEYRILFSEHTSIETGDDNFRGSSSAYQAFTFKDEGELDGVQIEYISLLGANSGKHATIW